MEIIKKTLPNGLKVFLIPMKGAKSITGRFVVKAGWKYEVEEELQGIAHFIEHMAFKGTTKRPTTKDISTEIESKGAIANAGTAEEYVTYFIKSSSQFKPMVYDVLSDIVLNPLMEQSEIDREAGTIIEEIRFYESTPANHVLYLWPQLLYGNQPAGRGGLGKIETVRSFKRNQLLDFIRQLYVTSNSAIILAGNLERTKKELEKINRYFKSLSSKPPTRVKPPVKESQTEPQLLLLPKDIEQTWVCLGTRGYSAQSENRYALELLRIILGEGMSSRMFIEIREQRGLAYAIKSHYDSQSDIGSVMTWAGLNSNKIEEALKVMLAEYQKIASEKVSDQELQKAKDFVRGREELNMEDSALVSAKAAENFAVLEEVPDFQQELQKYTAVTPEDLQRAAQDIFKNEKLNLAIIGPHARQEEKLRKLLRFE